MTREEIDKLVTEHKVVLFMKGNKQAPACGFSMKAVNILQILDVQFETRDVLTDSKLRENIKQYSEWPTIPQLYINGEFIGGCDIIVDMFHDKSLAEALDAKN
tara:strand:- start:5335 stop:5643 length:309 start_codon:yes stop_codon:yes gene_type:complete